MDQQSLTESSSFIQPQEYFLQGIILESSLENALQKLKGISDDSDQATQEFHDHETGLILSIKTPSNTNSHFRIKIRRSLIQQGAPCYLRYHGPIECLDKNIQTLYRTSLEISVSNNALSFFFEMGFQKEYEYIAKGYLFHKGKLKVTLSKIYNITRPGNYDAIEPLSSSYLIEFSIIAPPSQKHLAETIKLFADQLKTIVKIEKMNIRPPVGSF